MTEFTTTIDSKSADTHRAQTLLRHDTVNVILYSYLNHFDPPKGQEEIFVGSEGLTNLNESLKEEIAKAPDYERSIFEEHAKWVKEMVQNKNTILSVMPYYK